jgi:hypothetical protein
LSLDTLTNNRRAVVLALVACLGAAPIAQKPTSSAVKNSRSTSTFTEQRRKEVQAVLTLADDLAAGRTVPNDLALTWVRDDLFKGQENKQYIPFTVSLDPAKLATAAPAALSGEALEIYWRVVPRNAPAPAATPSADAPDSKKLLRSDVAYEDITPAAVVAGPVLRLSRSFLVPPGSYDVYVVVRETASPVRGTPKAAAIKRSVVVPDLWNGDLNVSTVVIAERIEPLTTALTPQQRAARPYAFETVELVPYTRMRFTKRDELSAFLQIYNAQTDSVNKPDVSVQFNFYLKQAAGGEKFFNNTMPTNLNARTLPKEFSLGSGRPLQTGQAVQLATFPEGEYRLEIRVTDNLARKSLARDVSFAVSAT